MAETKTVNLEVNSNLAQTEQAVTSLRSELRKAQAEVAAMSDKFGAASKEAIEAAKRAADLKDRIGDAKDLTDAFNPDAKFKALAGAANIAAGALAGFEGAMGLVGVQSEDAQQAILKVQSALAVSQGLDVLQQIPDTFRNIKAVAVNAFGAIKGAIGATGIGLLVVALGALYANWDALKNLVGESIPALKEGTKQFDKLKEVFFGVGNAIVQYLLTPFKSVLKILQLDFKGAINEIKKGYDVIGNYEKGAAKERQDQNDAYAKARLEKRIKDKENEIAVAKALGNDTYNLEKDNLHRKLLLNKGNQEELEKIRQEERVLDATHKKALQDKQKAHNDELKKKREEALAEEKKKREEAEKQRSDAENAKGRAAEEEYEKSKQKHSDDLEEELNNMVEFDEREAENEKKRKEKQLEAETLFEQQKNDVIAKSKENLSNIISGLEATGIAKSKAGQAISKAIALTQIGIDSAVAISKASTLANAEGVAAQLAFPTVPGIGTIARITSYASTALSVAANIVRAKQLLSSGGSASGSSNSGGRGSAPSGGGGGMSPQFNVVGNSGVNQLAETMQGRSAQAPIQAYVVANDVTTAQGLNRNIVTNASLG
jgi:hypothetical protein